MPQIKWGCLQNIFNSYLFKFIALENTAAVLILKFALLISSNGLAYYQSRDNTLGKFIGANAFLLHNK